MQSQLLLKKEYPCNTAIQVFHPASLLWWTKLPSGQGDLKAAIKAVPLYNITAACCCTQSSKINQTWQNFFLTPLPSPPWTAPEQCVGPPSPPCACSRSTPTGAAAGRWVSCQAAMYRSDPPSPRLKVRRSLCAHIDTRGSGRRPYRVPAGSSQT